MFIHYDAIKCDWFSCFSSLIRFDAFYGKLPFGAFVDAQISAEDAADVTMQMLMRSAILNGFKCTVSQQ